MTSKLIITLSALTLVIGQGIIFANEGHDHGGGKHSMTGTKTMMDNQMSGETTKAVEVGNKICPISGDKIEMDGEMGNPGKYEYNGKTYNFCCPMCIKDFKKDPEKFSKIAEEEIKLSE